MTQKIHKNFKLDLKSFKFGAIVGLALLIAVSFLGFFWPLMAIYMFLFMYVGYEKDGGLREVSSLGLGQAMVILPIAIALSAITNNSSAINNSVLALIIAAAVIIVLDYYCKKNSRKRELAKAHG